MLQKFFITCLLITSYTFSQNQVVKSFAFNASKIDYARIDYSNYGVSQFYIIMYNDIPENKKVVKNAAGCLQSFERLYHTLYFFIPIPTDISEQRLKNELLASFIAHLQTVESLEKADLYLILDDDSSIKFKQTINGNSIIKIVKNPKRICKYLTLN